MSVLLVDATDGANTSDNGRGMLASYSDLQIDRLTSLRCASSSRRVVSVRSRRSSAVARLCLRCKSRIETRIWIRFCRVWYRRSRTKQGAASVLLAGTADGANIEDNERGMVASYGDLQIDRLTLLRFVNSSRRAVHARCCRYSAVTCLCRHWKSRIETRVWIRLRRV